MILKLRGSYVIVSFDGTTLGEKLLYPTRIYVDLIKKIGDKIQINAIAHITGGGLIENLPRVIPNHLQANIELASWKQPPIFSWLQEKGNINSFEMHKTFNCGIGMVISVGQNDAEKAIDILNEKQANASLIGYLLERSTTESIQLIE